MDLYVALLPRDCRGPTRSSPQRNQSSPASRRRTNADNIAAVARAGESAAKIAPIDATPAGRAASGSADSNNSRARSAVIPPSANTGIAPALTSRAQPARTPRRPLGRLRIRIEDRPEDREVSPLARRARNTQAASDSTLRLVARPEQLARHADANRVERQMNPVGVRGNCHIDAIVHYQQRTSARANLAKPQAPVHKVHAPANPFHAAATPPIPGWRRRQRSFASRDQVTTLNDVPISDQIKPKPSTPAHLSVILTDASEANRGRTSDSFAHAKPVPVLCRRRPP